MFFTGSEAAGVKKGPSFKGMGLFQLTLVAGTLINARMTRCISRAETDQAVDGCWPA